MFFFIKRFYDMYWYGVFDTSLAFDVPPFLKQNSTGLEKAKSTFVYLLSHSDALVWHQPINNQSSRPLGAC
jgi:hypothetical protein